VTNEGVELGTAGGRSERRLNLAAAPANSVHAEQCEGGGSPAWTPGCGQRSSSSVAQRKNGEEELVPSRLGRAVRFDQFG
jgi:hypothetical protein